MKSVVIYFSQTGNTEKIGNAIAAGIAEATGECDVFEIREIGPLELGEYDLIGLGSPVMGAAPANVVEFAGKMRFVGGKHCFTSAPTVPPTEDFIPPCTRFSRVVGW